MICGVLWPAIGDFSQSAASKDSDNGKNRRASVAQSLAICNNQRLSSGHRFVFAILFSKRRAERAQLRE